jgi:hypothetical protein
MTIGLGGSMPQGKTIPNKRCRGCATAQAQPMVSLVSNRIGPNMTQDAASGREGRDFGMKSGRALAAQLGTLVSKTATELRLPDLRMATLRVARNDNTTFGCLNTLRDRVDVILCAYTKDGRSFDLWELPVDIWQRHAREASTGSTLRGKLTQMSRSAVTVHGKSLGRVVLTER